VINHFGKYTIFPVKIGWLGLVSTDKGIFASILPQNDAQEAEKRLLDKVPFRSELSKGGLTNYEEKLKRYFLGETVSLDFPIDWSWATPFQKRVLEIVQRTPRSSYLTYGEVAAKVGKSGAARAVGAALAANNIPVVLPCHRVIMKNGKLGGFTGAGLHVKAHLLALEGAELINTQKETGDSTSIVSFCVYCV
jgi:methylated-DNA-[protein]-cysteine S-methyltransferase